MIRSITTALLCAAAIIAGDVVFRTSLLRHLRPIILTPPERAVVDPPVALRWEGPQPMRVLLSIVGGEPQDLGAHESPFEISNGEFPRDGGYQVELQSLTFGGWVGARRRFRVHLPPPPARQDPTPPREEIDDLLQALDVARQARDGAQARQEFLSEENAALRDESERLARQLESLYEAQEDDAAHTAELENRLAQLAEEVRALVEENAAMRLRLGSVIPCTVWGYYSYPRPQTIPVTRRVLMVSDTRGRIFRARAECEIVRRADVTAASVCFCVGNSWGG